MQGEAGRINYGVVIEEGHFKQPFVKRRGREKSAPTFLFLMPSNPSSSKEQFEDHSSLPTQWTKCYSPS
jgi:hypothetical protein